MGQGPDLERRLASLPLGVQRLCGNAAHHLAQDPEQMDKQRQAWGELERNNSASSSSSSNQHAHKLLAALGQCGAAAADTLQDAHYARRAQRVPAIRPRSLLAGAPVAPHDGKLLRFCASGTSPTSTASRLRGFPQTHPLTPPQPSGQRALTRRSPWTVRRRRPASDHAS